MYPVGKANTGRGTKTAIKKLIGTVLIVAVCVAVGAVVVFTIKKIGESDMPATTEEPLTERIFTNNGAVGRHGPTKLHYKDPRLVAEVTVHKGIQHWTVPRTGLWYIMAVGAAGADGLLKGGARLKGGTGMKMNGYWIFNKGEVVKILVGQKGTRDILDPRRPGGGGGGTFVVLSKNFPLMIAPGGGGGGVPPPAAFQTAGGRGRWHDTYKKESDVVNGIKGSGGKLYDTNTRQMITNSTGGHKVIAGAGGGFKTNGVGYFEKWGGRSFLHGGVGGEATPQYSRHSHGSRAQGGFGGGGAAGLLPGGGGGYSGGGVSGCWLECSQGKEAGTAQGGSPFNRRYMGGLLESDNEGHGRVEVDFSTDDEDELTVMRAEIRFITPRKKN